MSICFLAIGSNLGARKHNINLAIREINKLKDTSVIKTSKIIETHPLGGPAGQPRFLNGALKIKTEIPPFKLLRQLKKIEHKLGRRRTVRHGPRIIDIDILFYADLSIKSRELNIPHPHMFDREFVMKPFYSIL